MSSIQITGLTTDEIGVECLLRGIDPSDINWPMKLETILKTEESNPAGIPIDCHTQDIVTEFSACKSALERLNTLKDNLNDKGDLLILQNRVHHWRNRTVRLKGRFHQDNEVDRLVNAWRRLRSLIEKWIEHWSAMSVPTEKKIEGAAATSPKKVITPRSTSLPAGTSSQPASYKKPNTVIDESQELSDGIRKIWEAPPPHTDYATSSAPRSYPVVNQISYQSMPSNTCYTTPPNQYSLRSDPKWNISFKGNTTSLEINDFLFRFESLAKRDRISEHELDSLLPRFLKETAEKWFWVYVRKNPEARFAQIRRAMIQRFSGYDSEREVRKMIENRKQRPKESFNDFVLDLESMNCQLNNSFF